ncbi:hypothetical protein, partial [Escherichia coli]|uniref:hypothetical protein n=1 Tax=Escherichia coli TaxID=562 RepID=UPI001BC84039
LVSPSFNQSTISVFWICFRCEHDSQNNNAQQYDQIPLTKWSCYDSCDHAKKSAHMGALV